MSSNSLASLISQKLSSRCPRSVSGKDHLFEQVLTSLQETAKLEAQAYDLAQKTAIAEEAKNVLDSWVRYEGQVKQRQQRELADAVIAKIEKDLEDPKVLRQILDQSVKDVERKFLKQKASLKSF